MAAAPQGSGAVTRFLGRKPEPRVTAAGVSRLPDLFVNPPRRKLRQFREDPRDHPPVRARLMGRPRTRRAAHRRNDPGRVRPRRSSCEPSGGSRRTGAQTPPSTTPVQDSASKTFWSPIHTSHSAYCSACSEDRTARQCQNSKPEPGHSRRVFLGHFRLGLTPGPVSPAGSRNGSRSCAAAHPGSRVETR